MVSVRSVLDICGDMKERVRRKSGRVGGYLDKFGNYQHVDGSEAMGLDNQKKENFKSLSSWPLQY